MKSKKLFAGLGIVTALGAAVIPMSSYAVTNSDTGSVDVELKVGSTISMALSNSQISSAILTSESDTTKTTVATVSSNSASGYTITAETSTSDGSLSGTSSNSIAYSNSFASATEGWALGVDGTWKTISGNTVSLLSSGASVATNEETTINYGFKTSSSTTPDTYSATLTYTAAVK